MASIPTEEILLQRGKAKYDTKEKVYGRLVEYLDCEIYEDDFTESTVCDIVNAVI